MILRWWFRRSGGGGGRTTTMNAGAGVGGLASVVTLRDVVIYVLLLLCCVVKTSVANLPPVFKQDMNNVVLSEDERVGSIVYRLEGYDPEGSNVTFGLLGSDNFHVDPQTGDVSLVKPLDRELQDTLSFFVTIKDQVAGNGEDSTNDNVVEVPITVIVSDENDNRPEFQNVPYETDVLEDAAIGTTVFGGILVTDRDTVGETLNVSCAEVPSAEKLPTSVGGGGLSADAPAAESSGCEKFSIELVENNQDKLRAVVVLRDKLDYNEKMIYHLMLTATDGVHTSTTGLELRVKDVQNSPPVFQGSLAAVIDEDAPIGTLVMTFQAKDGDRGQPRKIVYDLLTNPMEYFLLDARTGELRTAKPLDKEALPDATGLIAFTVRARELVNGAPVADALTATQANASITIRDVNDSPPAFNQRNYFVTLPENTAPGTPLPLEMSVRDPDVGQNAVFSLRLDDVSHVFDVEPKRVEGASQVSIRVTNGTLDYENPNQRKFIVLVIAEETETAERLSATATLTVSVTDMNDNRPVFEEDTYSVEVPETAGADHMIATITARDLDAGRFGDAGIRYSLSGTGAELFHVDARTGVITVAECPAAGGRSVSQRPDGDEEQQSLRRRRRQTTVASAVFTAGDGADETTAAGTSGFGSSAADDEDALAYQVFSGADAEQMIAGSTSAHHRHAFGKPGPGTAPCLDFEAQSEYYLTYKATDDEGHGQNSVVSLRIVLRDVNDAPPVCESPLYRATLDEGATVFDPPLQIRVRDPDTVSDLTFRLNGDDIVTRLFSIDARTGQLAIRNTSTLDVTHLNSENVFFTVEANDGLYSTQCDVNITIRDVNNHAPHFQQEHYVADVEESMPIGTSVQQIHATDLDSGINAEIRYRIQQGSFDDFAIDNGTGLVTISRKLDFDRRNTYQIEIVAADLGTPSLSGTASLTVNIINSNDKDPYFTPATQRAEIAEDAAVGALVHRLVALDPDVANAELLDYAATEPITAVDKDGVEIVGNDDFKYLFNVDRSGRVTVARRLNRDAYAVVRISVLVTDTTAPVHQQGHGLLVITIIDVNEMPPVFSPPWTPTNPRLNFHVIEEQPIGSALTTLTAHDDDSNIESFELSANPYFEINNVTGLIRSTARIDYERVKVVPLTATVRDSGIPQLSATAQLSVEVINLNDNRPHFNASQYEFAVLENAPRGTVIGRLEAYDEDAEFFGEIVYALVGDEARHFAVDADTGVVSVANATFFDRERRPEVSVTAVATDKAPITTRKSTTVPVHVTILDENDNRPVFTQHTYEATIAENVALNPPAAILKVVAFDADADSFGSVKYLITSGRPGADLFRLDADSGILYPRQSLHGLKGDYHLDVEARDVHGTGPHADNATIRIHIDSVNSYRPVFVMPALSNASVELQDHLVTADYLVMTVKATDNDTGHNGQLSYHLQLNNAITQATAEFRIDEHSGELRTRRQLDRQAQAKYELVLVARDHGTPVPFETLRFLTITLVDQTENRPEFPDASNPYHFRVYENGERAERIGQIRAATKERKGDGRDGGQETVTPIYYYMLLGNENWAFTLDKLTGDVYTNRTLDREDVDAYHLYVLASAMADLHVSEAERAAYSIKSLERDSTVAKILVTVLDRNDNGPAFAETVVYAGVNTRSGADQLVAVLNASDADDGENAALELLVVKSNLYKFGTDLVGSINPGPFNLTADGRLKTAVWMAEYNQDRFELDVMAKELAAPGRVAMAKVYIWVFQPDQLVRVILSRPPSEVNALRSEIVSELRNATGRRIIVAEIRHHIDPLGRMRTDWCDLFFHAVDERTLAIVPVDDVLRVIDAHYDFLRDYYAGYAIENVVPAHSTFVEEEFDLALAALVALVIVLFVGAISFAVLCCCLRHWSVSIPTETRRNEALIKKQQIVEDLSTTENPLWIEQKLKLYEEQELTMQVFSEPEMVHGGGDGGTPLPMAGSSSISSSSVAAASAAAAAATILDRRNSYEASQLGDNTYATIQPRSLAHLSAGGLGGGGVAPAGSAGAGGGGGNGAEVADYATLRNGSRAPSLYEFTGSTFQAPISRSAMDADSNNYVAELI